jgi:signal transduction histidine kinase/CheY-like chemotaxis protein
MSMTDRPGLTETERLIALRNYQILDTAPEPRFDGIVGLASQLCAAPCSLISFMDADRQWFKARLGMTLQQTRRADAFCTYTIQGERGLIVRDALEDERFRTNRLVVGPPHIRFYAGVPLISPCGAALGTVCVIDYQPREIAEHQMEGLRVLGQQVVTELELRRSRAQAQAANRAESLFVANLSHEVRTPLTAIAGFAELLQACEVFGEHDERGQWVQMIHQNTEQLLTLVTSLLDVTRLETGDLLVNPGSAYIRHLASEVYLGARPVAAEKGLKLTLKVDALVPRLLITDAQRLRQVLACLVDNAIKFTEAGGVTIRMQLESSPSGPVLRLDVIDTGPGIPDAHQPRLFECFEQADPSSTRVHGGTGVGLFISRGICERLGGSLELTGSSASGSTFTIRVPAHSDVLAEHSEPAVAEAGDDRPRGPGGWRLLVVDDVPTNRHLMAVMLRDVAGSVEVATNGQEAVDRMERGGIDAVLMDIQMPVMDGYTATRMLRERGDDTPIIAVTAHAMTEDEARCRAAGCDGYLAKPFRSEQLLDVLHRLLGGPSAAAA